VLENINLNSIMHNRSIKTYFGHILSQISSFCKQRHCQWETEAQGSLCQSWHLCLQWVMTFFRFFSDSGPVLPVLVGLPRLQPYNQVHPFADIIKLWKISLT